VHGGTLGTQGYVEVVERALQLRLEIARVAHFAVAVTINLAGDENQPLCPFDGVVA